MKFTDGFWLARPGVTLRYAEQAYAVSSDDRSLDITAPSRVVVDRGDTLNLPVLGVTISSPLEGVLRVRVQHHAGTPGPRGFDLLDTRPEVQIARDDGASSTLRTGSLTARIRNGSPWALDFEHDGQRITGAGHRSIAHATVDDSSAVSAEPVGLAGYAPGGRAPSKAYTLAQLDLGIGETIYGLGERFGPLTRNGQSIDIWQSDGGTSSEQAYKNVPFYLSSAGYGVLVNSTGHVSYEVGSESVERVQFSVPGETLEYLVIDGPTPAEVLERYTRLTGRPPRVPAWSFGLWLSTSFTTQYDEATLSEFVNGMAERRIPLSVFHFDCFWMHEFQWTDFIWDPSSFPDPEGMLARLHTERELHVSAWLNPYIAQRSALFAEGAKHGYLVRRPDGSVWQWDWWQAGMALVDFTNPDATAWFQSYVRALVRQGVDAIKTDFGERIPTDVVWHDGSAPGDMHNRYTQLYNRAVFEVLTQEQGTGEAVLFARSATAGGQTMPVHWGGDSVSSFASMAETLRGGLSLAASGFGYWSHDIGGFEGTPDPAVFKRWVAFGLMSSHSRLHSSDSYRVPWAFDDEAVSVTRVFARLKNSLAPYLYAASIQTTDAGLPIMRPMFLAFPDDLGARHLDRQYMLGDELLVAPVFSENGEVDVYLPQGIWTSLLTGERVSGGGWRHEQHGFDSLPLYVRAGAIVARGTRDDRVDYDYLGESELHVYEGGDWRERRIVLMSTDGSRTAVHVVRENDRVHATDENGRDIPVRAI